MGIDDLSSAGDFVVAFAVVHEMPDPERFFRDSFTAFKIGGRMLFSESARHIEESEFTTSLDTARRCGFMVERMPSIRSSKSAVLIKW